MDEVEDFKAQAKARGLRVEEGDGYNEYAVFRGDEYIGSAWYMEEFGGGWTTIEPDGVPAADALEELAPSKKRKPVRRELEYLVTFGYGRGRAPEAVPDGAAEAVVAAAAKLVKKAAPGATKVEVTSTGGVKATVKLT